MDIESSKIIKIIKNNILLIFSIPIFINFILNLMHNSNNIFFEEFEIAKLISLTLGTIFFIYLSIFINNLFNFGGKSLSLVLFLSSYFILDVILLFISKKVSFHLWVIFVTLTWLIFIFYKTKNPLEILNLVIFFLIFRFFNYFFITDITNNIYYQELNTDVYVQWFEIAKMIYEHNYFLALESNLISGQGLFPSYIQALLLEIGFGIENFKFIQINSFLFLSFSILLISDLQISKNNKIISSILFCILVLNNEWLKYLLVNSLMLEGIVSFFIAVYLYNFIRMYENRNLVSIWFFICFGGMILTKNFVSLISLLLIIFSFFALKYKRYFIVSLFAFGVNLLYQNIYFSRLQSFAYTNEINFKNLFLDFIHFRSLDFTNIFNILKQFIIDKPTTYLVLIFFIINLIRIYKKGFQLTFENLNFSFVLLNLFFINLLYISYWRNVEIQSSYRYIINCFHLIFISSIIHLSKFESVD